MPLSRTQVIDAAVALLNDYGLASLSMRQLAKSLDVQPGALYWHVKSKQDLLAAIAHRMTSIPLPDAAQREPLAHARAVAHQFRASLLAYRDAAEIVSLAQALTPSPLPVRQELHRTLATLFTPQRALWGAAAVTRYVLGSVSEQQNAAELLSAGIVSDGVDDAERTAEFGFGLDALLAGMAHIDHAG